MGNNLIMLYHGLGRRRPLLVSADRLLLRKTVARERRRRRSWSIRVGDFGFGLGIMLCFLAFELSPISAATSSTPGCSSCAESKLTVFQQHALQWIPFLLMLGAFGKSAQFPCTCGCPTRWKARRPYSALIHAATMVTARRLHDRALRDAVRRQQRRHDDHRGHRVLHRALFAGAIALRPVST